MAIKKILKTALSKMPEIALVIKTDNAPLLESAIHTALRQLDLVAPDHPLNGRKTR
jgi:hypothetical protein